MHDRQKSLKAAFSVVAIAFGPAIILNFYNFARNPNPGSAEIIVLTVATFLYALYLPRMFIVFFLPSISINEKLLFRACEKKADKFETYIEIGNFSNNSVYEINIFIEEVLSDCVTFVKKIQDTKISQLPAKKGKDISSITSICLEGYDKNHWRKTENKIRVTVIFVTQLFNCKGFTSTVLIPESPNNLI